MFTPLTEPPTDLYATSHLSCDHPRIVEGVTKTVDTRRTLCPDRVTVERKQSVSEHRRVKPFRCALCNRDRDLHDFPTVSKTKQRVIYSRWCKLCEAKTTGKVLSKKDTP